MTTGLSAVNDSFDWPNGEQHRELQKGDPQEKAFKQSKWVWVSTGNAVFKGSFAEKRRCLGVLKCSTCERLVRPKTKGLPYQKGVACTMSHCPGILQHISCTAVSYHSQVVRDGEVFLMWDHTGSHNHPHPPGGALTEQEKS